MSNLGMDMGMSDFRVGTFRNYLVPMGAALSRTPGMDIRFLANRVVAEALAKGGDLGSCESGALHVVDWDGIGDTGSTHRDFMVRSPDTDLTDSDIETIGATIDAALQQWVPEIIVCWEASTDVIRRLYPNTLVIDVMPSFFMRPPYPKLLSFDPFGIYDRCWYRDLDLEAIEVDDRSMQEFLDLRKTIDRHLRMIDVRGGLKSYCKPFLIDDAWLIPLQISEYFSWKNFSIFGDQIDLVEDVLRGADSDTASIFTHYTGSTNREIVIDDPTYARLRSSYPNFVFDRKFDTIDTVSQYFVPCVKTVCSVSSTLGFQAKFFNKFLVSPSTSHLSYIADSREISGELPTKPRALDSFLAFCVSRTFFESQRLISDTEYSTRVLSGFFHRWNDQAVDADAFPEHDEIESGSGQLINSCKPDLSQDVFRSVFHNNKVSSVSYVDEMKYRMLDDTVHTISFDVFDTLVYRVVFRPSDVFELMANHLETSPEIEVPKPFVARFPMLRARAEQCLRRDRDLALPTHDVREELGIEEIYLKLVLDENLDPSLVEALISIERDKELDCLRQRPIGKDLFDHAMRSGRRVIMISDFVHDAEFVARVLRSCGYRGWQGLYVSSDVGRKKHSGSLFSAVRDRVGEPAGGFLHIGDNVHGDVSMAKGSGFQARLLPSGARIAETAVRQRHLDWRALETSFFGRAFLSMYVNGKPLPDGLHADRGEVQLIESPRDFGFLVLGPMMLFFTKWILAEADRKGVSQILFFARDSVLPYRIAEIIRARRRGQGPNIVYVPVSRLALAGLDLHKPADVELIRIDDFPETGTLGELLQTRFSLSETEVSRDAVQRWTRKPVGKVRLHELSAAAVYDIARASAQEHWATVDAALSRRRSLVREFLVSLGVRLDEPAAAVDFGYHGTIHRKLESVFDAVLHPLFFMTYTGGGAGDPMPTASVFYARNLNPRFKTQNAFLAFNLILETLINERVGSVTGYRRQGDRVVADREPFDDFEHRDIIQQVHAGVLEFAEAWLENGSVIDRHASLDGGALEYMFDQVMRWPTVTEATNLGGIIFDNRYAGHEPRRIIPSGSSDRMNDHAVWREGASVLSRDRGSDQRHKLRKFTGSRAFQRVRYCYTPIVGMAVRRIGGDAAAETFRLNPHVFFRRVRKPLYRKIGRILYP